MQRLLAMALLAASAAFAQTVVTDGFRIRLNVHGWPTDGLAPRLHEHGAWGTYIDRAAAIWQVSADLDGSRSASYLYQFAGFKASGNAEAVHSVYGSLDAYDSGERPSLEFAYAPDLYGIPCEPQSLAVRHSLKRQHWGSVTRNRPHWSAQVRFNGACEPTLGLALYAVGIGLGLAPNDLRGIGRDSVAPDADAIDALRRVWRMDARPDWAETTVAVRTDIDPPPTVLVDGAEADCVAANPPEYRAIRPRGYLRVSRMCRSGYASEIRLPSRWYGLQAETLEPTARVCAYQSWERQSQGRIGDAEEIQGVYVRPLGAAAVKLRKPLHAACESGWGEWR